MASTSPNLTLPPNVDLEKLEVEPGADADEPDTYRRAPACRAVAGAFMAVLLSFGHLSAFGTFQAWYMDNQLHDLPASTVAWIGSVQLFAFFASGAGVGHVCDAYGPSGLLLAGAALTTFSISMTSMASKFYQFLLCHGILFGLGAGMLFYPSMTSASAWFTQYRATALGLAATGSSVGGAILPILLNRLLALMGFAWALRVLALMNAAGCLLSWSLVSSPAIEKAARGPIFDSTMYRDGKYVLLLAGSCLISCGLYIPPTYLVSFFEAHDLPPPLATYALSALNAAGALGRILPAYLADLAGPLNLLAPAAALSGAVAICLAHAPSAPAPIMALAAVYGFLSGAFISVVTPCVARLSPAGRVGARVGVLYSAISVPSLLAGPVAGALLRQGGGSYTSMMLYAGVVVICGSALVAGARFMVERRLLARV
ncbi:major facilitator superfamily domain-containing protein [Schizophyllum fasciatum]